MIGSSNESRFHRLGIWTVETINNTSPPPHVPQSAPGSEFKDFNLGFRQCTFDVPHYKVFKFFAIKSRISLSNLEFTEARNPLKFTARVPGETARWQIAGLISGSKMLKKNAQHFLRYKKPILYSHRCNLYGNFSLQRARDFRVYCIFGQECIAQVVVLHCELRCDTRHFSAVHNLPLVICRATRSGGEH